MTADFSYDPVTAIDESGLSRQAPDTITGYVRNPSQVARMVTICHALAEWLGR
jgi:hypothetical protein